MVSEELSEWCPNVSGFSSLVMDFALWIDIISTVVIAIVAVAMYCNAQAVKKLEEANQKTALWPEIREIILEVDKYTMKSNDRNLNDTNSNQYIFDFLSVMEVAKFHFQKDDEIFNRLKQLFTVGGDLKVLQLELPTHKEGSDERLKLIHKLCEKRLYIFELSGEIKELLHNRFNIAISSDET